MKMNKSFFAAAAFFTAQIALAQTAAGSGGAVPTPNAAGSTMQAVAESLMTGSGVIVEAPPTPKPVAGQPAGRYSKTYAEVRFNNDGSTTIVSPAFQDPAGLGGLEISAGSSLNGVCGLFGFGEVQASLSGFNSRAPAVEIDSSGKLSGFLRASASIVLRYLTCAPGAASVPGETPSALNRAEKISRNDDGSFTVLTPFVEGKGGARFLISGGSSYEGVCRYFGFSRYVTGLTSSRYGITVGISSEGRINGFFDPDTDPDENWIDSVVCE